MTEDWTKEKGMTEELEVEKPMLEDESASCRRNQLRLRCVEAEISQQVAIGSQCILGSKQRL